jgi:hypothetical protein
MSDSSKPRPAQKKYSMLTSSASLDSRNSSRLANKKFAQAAAALNHSSSVRAA